MNKFSASPQFLKSDLFSTAVAVGAMNQGKLSDVSISITVSADVGAALPGDL